MTRAFPAATPAAEETPISIGLMGPPGGGKTFSALELATGIVSVRGGSIHVIDTEHRAQKYRDAFDYKVARFDPPFRPGDFLDAIEQQIAAGAGCVIVDSASDEHEGPGGVLDWKEEEVNRIAGPDASWSKREACAMAGWIKPKRDRLRFINGIQRMKTPLILCFRAREKTRPMKDDKGKTVPTNIGWQPIAPAEIVHAMDLTCLLPPRADGVPVWKSDKSGEDFVIKLPHYLRPHIQDGKPLSREMGVAFARWAAGGSSASAQRHPLAIEGDDAAACGKDALTIFWKRLTAAEREAVGGIAQRDAWAQIAIRADTAPAEVDA